MEWYAVLLSSKRFSAMRHKYKSKRAQAKLALNVWPRNRVSTEVYAFMSVPV